MTMKIDLQVYQSTNQYFFNMKYFLQHKRPQYIYCIITVLYFLTQFLINR